MGDVPPTNSTEALERVNEETPALFGFVYHNPDVGTEFAPNHPIQSGEVHDASDIRPATEFEAWLVGELQTAEALASTYREENERLREGLERADAALRDYACHGGPDVPCIRSMDQCAAECGQHAGDALLVVTQALTTPRTETPE